VSLNNKITEVIKIIKTMNIKKFGNACMYGALIGGAVWVISHCILLEVGTIYASSTDVEILKNIQLSATQPATQPHVVPLTGAGSELTQEQKLSLLTEELARTKEELKQNSAALKSLTDNISGHFISNYRDTITVLGAGLGIAAAVLGGLIAWSYGVLKDELTKKIKEEAEEAHTAMVKRSESGLFTLIYKNLSYAFYRYYRVILDDPGHPGFKGGVELATWFAEGTIENALKIPAGKERDRMVNGAKLHLLYHNGCQRLRTDSVISKKELIDQAATHHKRLNEANEDKADLYSKDTIAWIYILWGDEPLKEKGKEILRNILADPAITVAYRTELEENYKKREIELTALLSLDTYQPPGPGDRNAADV